MWQMMRRPRWLGMLALVLAVAGGFAALAQWQISRAVENAVVIERDTETVLPLGNLQQPQHPTTDAVAEHRVAATGRWLPDYVVIAERVQGERSGFWVAGRFAVSATEAAPEASLAVALGWVADAVEARSITERLNRGEVLPEVLGEPTGSADPAEPTAPGRSAETITGRFYPGEAPERRIDGVLPAMAPAALANLWQASGPEQAFSGYLVLETPPEPLAEIAVRVPQSEVQFSWLNIFYAIEWLIFALFALYIWYRMVRDAYRAEQQPPDSTEH